MIGLQLSIRGEHWVGLALD